MKVQVRITGSSGRSKGYKLDTATVPAEAGLQEVSDERLQEMWLQVVRWLYPIPLDHHTRDEALVLLKEMERRGLAEPVMEYTFA